MTTLVLARKYRPAHFGEMVGQAHVVQALAHALASKRLHHAYLFTGTRGVGKTTVSRILAKSLNCVGPDGQGDVTAQPCGQCLACRDIDAGRFVDYIELDAASNRGVEEISQLLDQAVYKPVVGRFKVYMIDEVHMLSNTAFNAMLKTLEEPPDYLKFVLATTDPQKVPPTVLSRCLQFNLRPMAPDIVQAHLAQVLQAEQVPAEAGALALLARAAHGSMRDALSLVDQAIAFGGGALREDAVRQMLGAADRRDVLDLIASLAEGDGAAVIARIDALQAQGQAALGVLDDMAWALQQMAVLQFAATAPVAAGWSAQERETLAALADALGPEETQLLYSLCLRGRQELALAPDEYGGLTMTLLRLLAFRPAPAGLEGAAAPARGEGRAAAPPRADLLRPGPPRTVRPVAAPARPVVESPARSPIAPAPAPEVLAPPARAATPAATPATKPDGATAAGPSAAHSPWADRWDEVVQQLCATDAVQALVRELALQSACTMVDPGADPEHWMLVCERETLVKGHAGSRLEAALATLLGHPVRLTVQQGPAMDTPAQRAARRAADRQRVAEEMIRADPLVTSLTQRFATARIVPGSVRPVDPAQVDPAHPGS